MRLHLPPHGRFLTCCYTSVMPATVSRLEARNRSHSISAYLLAFFHPANALPFTRFASWTVHETATITTLPTETQAIPLNPYLLPGFGSKAAQRRPHGLLLGRYVPHPDSGLAIHTRGIAKQPKRSDHGNQGSSH